MMKAMIFAAGKGTRLQPVTDKIPKALVNVGGKPLLEWLLLKIYASGIKDIVVNVHHKAEQVIDFLNKFNLPGINIQISDESDLLLDTGGGLKKAYNLFKGTAPILVHNVDILSNINFKQLEDEFLKSDAAALLVVKNRNTNRKLEFSDNNLLAGWRNEKTGKHITTKAYDNNVHALAFSGISVVSADFPALIKEDGVFGLIPACLKLADEVVIKKFELNHEWLDVGKPEVLPDAEKFIQTHYNIFKK